MVSLDTVRGAKGAAEYTGLPVRTIYHLTATGRLPVVRASKRLLIYRASDLDKALTPEPVEAAEAQPVESAAA